MGVKLREKQLRNGQVSFYLDIYHNKARWYEFLDIKIQKNRPSPEDKEKRRLAQEIRTKREHELIVEDNGLQDRKKKLACFVRFFENYTLEGNRNGMYHSVHNNLKKYMGKEPLPFVKVTPDWLSTFQKHLIKTVSNNSTVRYMEAISCALNEAVRKKIINRNPWNDIPTTQKLKMQDVFRKAYTTAELQKLASVSVNIDKQIKQAYFFSCFTGLRWSDVNPLRWDEIIVKNIQGKKEYYLYFEQEKTETIEYLPLSDSAIDILKERQRESADEEKSPYVFPRIKEKEDGRKTVYNWMHRKLKVWAKAAGIDPKKLHFHTGRHSFATNVLESADGDLYTKCKWLDHLYDWVYIRGNDEKFSVLTTSYSDKAQQVKWVSIHYRCLLTCVLTISDMKTVEWADLAELTNAFTFLITTPYFQELPDNYPFTKEIVQLKDKLRTFCLETQNEACVQLKLKFDTKKELLLHRYELSMFPKITFHQLQMDFKAEHEKQVKKQKEEQEREKQLKEERPWQKRWREMNIK